MNEGYEVYNSEQELYDAQADLLSEYTEAGRKAALDLIAGLHTHELKDYLLIESIHEDSMEFSFFKAGWYEIIHNQVDESDDGLPF